jgi:hypothetical protein
MAPTNPGYDAEALAPLPTQATFPQFGVELAADDQPA